MQRGKFVRERLLCDPLPEPPPGVDTTPPEVDSSATTRERFEQHTSDPKCASCHSLIDPIGFGLEHYDGIGAWRDDEGGTPVDAAGEIAGLPGGSVAFEGAVALAEALAARPETAECVARKWFTYAFGRGPEAADTCALAGIDAAFESSGRDVRALLVSIAASDAFRFRPANQEGP